MRPYALSRWSRLLFALALSWTATLPAEEPPQAPTDEKEIQALIRQLESNDFETRENATWTLIRAGDAVESALENATQLKTFSPEARARIGTIRTAWEVAREQAARKGWERVFAGSRMPLSQGEINSLLISTCGRVECVAGSVGGGGKEDCYRLDEDWFVRISFRYLPDKKEYESFACRIVGFPDMRDRIEQDLYALLRDINRCKTGNDPLACIRALNRLRRAGKERVLAAIGAYFELCSMESKDWGGVIDERTGKWVVSALFRKPALATTSDLLVPDSGEADGWLIIDGCKGPEIGSLLDALKDANTPFCTRALVPDVSPVDAAEMLLASDRFKQGDEWSRVTVRARALRFLGELAPQGVDPANEKSWSDAVRQVQALNVIWDEKAQKFVKGVQP